MTEEKKTEKLFSEEEIKRMFDTDFLPLVQTFAKRLTEKDLKEKEIAYYIARMVFNFDDLDSPLTYATIGPNIQFQLQAITREELEKQKKEEEREKKKTNE